MDVSRYQHSESIRIKRSAADLYAIVSDLTRMGELSPVCTSCTWDDTAQAAKEGAWFTGHNVVDDFEWDTRSRVISADPGRDFTFITCGQKGDGDYVQWGYAFEERDGETTVTESWKLLPAYSGFIAADNPGADVKAHIEGMAAMARDGIRDTLANLKRVAET